MRAQPHVWWLASRASGVLALVLVTVSVAIGLAMSAKLMRKRKLGPALMAVHEQTALAGLLAIGVHGVTLLGDPWLHASVAGISVPFVIGYRTVFTGLGIIAGWLAAILGLSFYFRKHIGAKLWRKAHRATFLVWLLGMVHTIGAGTDASTPWLREFMVITGVAMTVLFARRLYGSDRVVLGRPVARGRLVETKALDQVSA
ncbi:MAG: methionine sulfoxide reductase heme-binding subunit [Thermoleophilaceae bacterium]|jgi:sulfoxide reductase heme-binding subunit YedZ|nr:methionine sulfoxide reductase heme-binding subunit [Thermoleophilaceae bacterium]